MGKGLGYFSDYPKHVFLILGNEFCERFSFYGMKAILVLYFTRALLMEDNKATAIYHSFNSLCYFMPIFGAMLADGLLGKFKTILYLSVIYCIGNATMSLAAIPDGDTYHSWATFVALFLIAIGTGGIKPCVSAFGADQFQEHQARQKESFFSMFYVAINMGSLLSMIITPMLRTKVTCFGEPCYPLAFGVPAILMLVAVALFIAGSSFYLKTPPGNNIIGNLFGCIGTAIGGRCTKKGGPKDHWLDYAEDKYGREFVTDVKAVMRVLFMFIPLPVFWALFEQQGSKWILQAGQMNGDFGGFVIQPDQMHAFNPLLVIALVPFMESVFFPCLNKLHIPNRPLQRLGVGLFLCGISFCITGGLQIAIENEAPAAVSEGYTRLNYINTSPCNVTITSWSDGTNGKTLYYNQMIGPEDVAHISAPNYINASFSNCKDLPDKDLSAQIVNLTESEGYSLVFYYNTSNIHIAQYFQNQTIRMDRGLATVQIMSTALDLEIQLSDDDETNRYLTVLGPSAWFDLMHKKYTVKGRTDSSKPFQTIGEIDSKAGAVYTIIIQYDLSGKLVLVQHEEVTPNELNMFLQLPQYIVMAFGEVFFSVTGLSFAYSQAPPSMKAVLQAGWLVTSAVGNLIVVIVSGAGMEDQVAEYFLFAGLMFITLVVFIIMSMFYVYVEDLPPVDDSDDEEKKKPEIIGEDNEGYVSEKEIEKQLEAMADTINERPTPYSELEYSEIDPEMISTAL